MRGEPLARSVTEVAPCFPAAPKALTESTETGAGARGSRDAQSGCCAAIFSSLE